MISAWYHDIMISPAELKKHSLKERRCKFKIDKTIYSMTTSRTPYDDSKNKPSLYRQGR